jgi:hypothetical protein
MLGLRSSRARAAGFAAGTLLLGTALVPAALTTASGIAAAATTPTISAVGALTALSGHPGTKAVAEYTVTAADGAALTNAYVYFSSGTPYTASSIPLSSSIPGCAAVVLSPTSASNALGCALPVVPAGQSLTFTYSAPLPVVPEYQVSYSADLKVEVVPNSQLGWVDDGTAGVVFSPGIAPGNNPGITASMTRIGHSAGGQALLVPAQPVVAPGKVWDAQSIVTAYNATISGLTVQFSAPAGTSVAAASSQDPAASFSCGPEQSGTILCSGGTIAAGAQADFILSGVAPTTPGTYPVSVVADPADQAPTHVTRAPFTQSASIPVSATLPDLSISTAKPSPISAGTSFTETFTITNSGSAPALSPTLTVLSSQYASSVTAPGLACTDTSYGHSGRGGGITHTGFACTTPAGTSLGAGGQISLTQHLLLNPSSTLTQTLTVSTTSVQLDQVPHSLTDVDAAVLPPVPSAPSGVVVSESAGSLLVSWTPGTAGGAAFSTTVTATPASGTPLSSVVAGTASSATLSGVAPATTYTITVVSSDAAGSAAAAPVQYTTTASTVPPGAPTVTRAVWNTDSEIVVAWSTPSSGDSPISDYEIECVPNTSDPGAPPPVVVDVAPNPYNDTGVGLDASYDWTITVRAANAAGFGPWSAPFALGGLLN